MSAGILNTFGADSYGISGAGVCAARRPTNRSAALHSNRSIERVVVMAGLLLCARRCRLRMQDDLLHAPRRDFGDEELVRVPAVDLVDRAELLELFARFAELADDRPVQLHLVDFAGDVPELRVAVIGKRFRDV